MSRRPAAVLPNALAAAIASGLSEIPPPPALRDRILAGAARDSAEFDTRLAEHADWQALTPLVDMRLLATDGATRSFVLRMKPGAVLPAHDHPGDEECLVLDGSCWLGEVPMKKGDYQLARRGSRHGAVRTDGGVVLFVRGPDPGATAIHA